MSSRMRGPLLVALAALLASGRSQAEPKKPAAKYVTQAEYARLQQQLNQQRELLLKVIQLQQQHLDLLYALVPEARPGAASSPAPVPEAPVARAPEPAPAPAPAPESAPRPTVKPRPAAGGKGTIVGRVVVKGGDPGSVWLYVDGPATAAPGGVTAQMRQKGKQFEPQVVVVRKGAKVAFPNVDPYFHNVFSLTPGNRFDLGSFQQGESKTVTMATTGVVSVYCNLHPQMVGWILVVPTAHHAKAGSDGFYRLANVPAGKHKLVAWTPNAKPMVRDIDVVDGEVTTVELELQKGKSQPHLNKEGLPYGSYK